MFKKSNYAIATKELDVAHDTIDRLEQRVGQLSSAIAQSANEIQSAEERIKVLVREDVANPNVDGELRKIDAEIQSTRQWMVRQQQLRQAAGLELAKAKLAVLNIEERILQAQADHFRDVASRAFDDIWVALRKVLPAAMRDASGKHVVGGLVASRHGRAGGTPVTFGLLWDELGRGIAARAKSEGIALIAQAAQRGKDSPTLTAVFSDRLSKVEREASRARLPGRTFAPEHFIAEIERITQRDAPRLNSVAECRDYVSYWEGKVTEYESVLSSLKSGTYVAPSSTTDSFDGHGWTEARAAEAERKEATARKAPEVEAKLQHARDCLASWRESLLAARERERPTTASIR